MCSHMHCWATYIKKKWCWEFLDSLIPSVPIIYCSGYILQTKSSVCPELILTLARAYVKVHHRTAFMSLFSLFQHCAACLVCLTCEMAGKWPYSSSYFGCCFEDLFKTTSSILLKFTSSFFSLRFIWVHKVHP